MIQILWSDGFRQAGFGCRS